jgi:hypothetical protein
VFVWKFISGQNELVKTKDRTSTLIIYVEEESAGMKANSCWTYQLHENVSQVEKSTGLTVLSAWKNEAACP